MVRPVRTFDRVPDFDANSRNYPVRAILGEAPPLVSQKWSCRVWLDQLAEGACVGFAFGHDIAAEPIVSYVDNRYARWIYHEAQKIDGFPPGTEGTSVLAGVKIMLREGWIEEYRWGFGLWDALEAVAHIGPVILGVNWYEDMFEPNLDGYIYPTGRLLGGHAILMIGVDFENERVLLHNSWGSNWGMLGRAWLKFADLDALLHDRGEACVPLVRADITINPEPTPPPVEERPGFWKRLWNLLTWPFRLL